MAARIAAVNVMIRPRFVLQPRLRGFRPGVLVVGAALALMQQPTSAQNLAYSVFERYLESLRVQAAIPGLSALIVQDGRVVWERGFGYADVEKSIAALPDTPYPIIDITQTFASVLLLQCEERGTLRLDDPLSTWSGTSNATVGQTLAHATAATGNGFRYDLNSFAQLTSPVEACGGQSARLRVARDIFDRLAMFDSVPGRDLDDPG